MALEELGVIIPVAMSIIAPLIIIFISRHLQVFDKTAQRSTFATFNISTVQEEVKEIKGTVDDTKEHFDRKLEGLTQLNEKREETIRIELRRVSEKVDLITTSLKLVEYRLDRMDRDSGSSGSRSGKSGAVHNNGE